MLIVAAQVDGSGTIEAKGGAGGYGDGKNSGGGGGGRVALHLTSSLSPSVALSASGGALGGSGAWYGAAGTIYTDVGGNRTLVLDNTPTTDLTSVGTVTLSANASSSASLTLDTLVITNSLVALQCPVHAPRVLMSSSTVVASEELDVTSLVVTNASVTFATNVLNVCCWRP